MHGMITFVLCPDCGGSAVSHCCDGLQEQPEKAQHDEKTQLAIGERLAKIREGLDLSQSEIARAIAVTPQAWNAWENGRERISIVHAIRLFEIFGVSLDWIYLGNAGKDKRW
jgi:DNA-binding XRE family transcriptional regulator